MAAHHHGVPFFVAAPTTTIDPQLDHGGLIPIEERSPEEVGRVHVCGRGCVGGVAWCVQLVE